MAHLSCPQGLSPLPFATLEHLGVRHAGRRFKPMVAEHCRVEGWIDPLTRNSYHQLARITAGRELLWLCLSLSVTASVSKVQREKNNVLINRV